MSKRLFAPCCLVAMFCLIISDSFAQSTVNLCNQFTQLVISNTSNTITLTNTAPGPPTGTYSVKLQYTDPNNGIPVTPATITTAVTAAGGSTVINWSPGNLPVAGGNDLSASSSVIIDMTTTSGASIDYAVNLNFGICISVLPLTLTSFTITNSNVATGYSKITWVTAQESNTAYFLLQRSVNGTTWSSHGIEPAAGNSSIALTYNFFTTMPNTGATFYYRLQMFDIDGRSTFSPVILMRGSGTTNPTSFCNYTTIEGPSTLCGSGAYKIHNAAAGTAWSFTPALGCVNVDNVRGGTTATISGFAAGAGTVTLSSTGCTKTKAVTVCSGTGITGPSTVCNTPATYTLLNAPAGAAISWTASPAGIVSISGGGTQITVTKITSGNFTLTASISFNCGTKNISSATYRAGGFSSGDYPVSGPSSVCKNSYASFSTNTLPGATSYTWFWPGGWTSASGQGTSSLSVRTNTSSGQVGVRVGNACDAGGSPGMIFVAVNSSCGGSFIVSPNPASAMVSIQPGNTSTTHAANAGAGRTAISSSITTVRLFDKMGTFKKEWKFAAGSKKAELDVTGISPGIYVLEIVDNNKTSEKQELIIRQ